MKNNRVVAVVLVFLSLSGEVISSPGKLTTTQFSNTPHLVEQDQLKGGSVLAHFNTQPNILLVIADDQGLDASSQYSLSQDVPLTPTLNELASKGLVFDNAWATPACTTTRGAIITGLHGVNSGIDTVPDTLEANATTLHRYLYSETGGKYATALIGKWHLSGRSGNNLSHPNDAGIGYYAGSLSGNLDDYYNWTLDENGSRRNIAEYNTSVLSDLAIDWIGRQKSPWFLWLAYHAGHTPHHLPPKSLHSRNLSGSTEDIRSNPRAYFLASLEALDTELGRILSSMPEDVMDNTVIIYMADNGTGARVVDRRVYPRNRAKGTLYEGSLRVPLLIAGAGVSRSGERDSSLVHAVDLFATIAQLAGVGDQRIGDSHSFKSLLSDKGAVSRQLNYAEYVSRRGASGWTVRNKNYKLIEYTDGSREFYDLTQDPKEENNLINKADDYADVIATLSNYAKEVRGIAAEPAEMSTNKGIDITGAVLAHRSPNCRDYFNHYFSTANDVGNKVIFEGSLEITLEGSQCVFRTNAIPNHDFNDGSRSFPHKVSEQNVEYRITVSPEWADSPTPLSLRQDNAILLNGVKVDLLAAGCFGVANERTGCNDLNTAWRLDPVHKANGFLVDSHNAHTQPDGTYHYHAKPNALFADESTTPSPVVGFAADGFPIYGSYFHDGSGVRKATSSYRLRGGMRPEGAGQPGGTYDGSFRDDYEFVEGLGDLDECNGMIQDGSYGYYITNEFPYILGCFKGTPDESFMKRR